MGAFKHLLPDPDTPTCTAHWIGAQLGFKGSDTRLAAYLDRLIEEAGFPKPLPHMKHGGGIGHGVHPARSNWIRAGVIEWLGDYLPPDAAAAIEGEAQDRAGAEMDDAAANLRLVADNDRQVA